MTRNLKLAEDPRLDDEEDVAEFLMHEGDAIMDGLGYKRGPDGRWSDEDLQRIWLNVNERGIDWAYRASGIIAE
jgi:hypothetical protein